MQSVAMNQKYLHLCEIALLLMTLFEQNKPCCDAIICLEPQLQQSGQCESSSLLMSGPSLTCGGSQAAEIAWLRGQYAIAKTFTCSVSYLNECFCLSDLLHVFSVPNVPSHKTIFKIIKVENSLRGFVCPFPETYLLCIEWLNTFKNR